MNNATSTLRSEHEAILKMLGATEELARRAESGEQLPAAAVAGLLEFFRIFADQCHHGKEEELLFPLLEEKGLPRQGGPLGVMLQEHDQGRGLIRDMRDAAAALESGDPGASRRWAAAAQAYVFLLRAHIAKENNVLFVLAERLLSAEEQAGLAGAFDRLELEKMGAGTHERLHSSMKGLLEEIYSGAVVAR